MGFGQDTTIWPEKKLPTTPQWKQFAKYHTDPAIKTLSLTNMHYMNQRHAELLNFFRMNL